MTDQLQSNREWWVQQWLGLLDKYRFKKRLERARNYAREGNVLSIDFEKQKAIAKVQGSEPEPYEVSLWLDPFSDEDWEYVTETLSQRAVFAAKLLAGEMPDNIDEAFVANGLQLFPFTLQEVRSRCSCPDKANPCKHIGAVYYLLGDRFGDDPFVLFQLRGRSKEEIIAALRSRRQVEPREETIAETPETEPTEAAIDLQQFWQYDGQLDPSLVVIAPPPDSRTAADILGEIPLGRVVSGSARSRQATIEAVQTFLDRAYQGASQTAIVAAMKNDE